MTGARPGVWRTLAFLVLLGAVAAGVYVLFARPAVSASPPLLQGGGASPSTGGALRVYVSGEVLRPGVYDMRSGQRVEDALALAGGPTARADLRDLNLAAKVRDELHVRVTALKATAEPAAAPTPRGGPLNLNTATREEMEALPGIGPAYAQRILDRRPYRSLAELEAVLGKSLYDRVRPLVGVE